MTPRTRPWSRRLSPASAEPEPADIYSIHRFTENITDGQLNFDLAVIERNTIAGGVESLLLWQSGDFSIYGIGTDVTSVAASLSANVEILEVDGEPIEPINMFASNTIVRDLPMDGPVVLAPWESGFGRRWFRSR